MRLVQDQPLMMDHKKGTLLLLMVIAGIPVTGGVWAKKVRKLITEMIKYYYNQLKTKNTLSKLLKHYPYHLYSFNPLNRIFSS